ncbi:MAG: ABC transporter permease [Thermoanaerobaculia bacterium]|nr:ABC transporter permease [Thermoanaerobaculia bacterium]
MTSHPPPPSRPRRWLACAVSRHPAGSSILGDLLEDFYRVLRDHGPTRARWWYWREATTLAVGMWLERIFQPFQEPDRAQETHPVIEALSLKGFVSDARYAVRALRSDLGLVTFSTLIVGLGIGATTAVFSVMSPLLLKPLPFEEPDRLVWISNTGKGGRSAVTSRTSNLRDFRQRLSTMQDVAGYNAFFEQESYTLAGRGEPVRLAGVGVTHDFLDVLGIEPMLGRSFTEEEGRLWDDSSIILTHAAWRQTFGGDPALVGDVVTINGAPSTVIGILPPDFDFSSIFSPSSRVDLLTTFPVDDETDSWGNTVSMIGRLVPGSTIADARAELSVALENLKQEYPERWGLTAQMSPLREPISGGHQEPLLLLGAASAAIMLIVCANLTSLLLSKGIHRRKEMMLRTALGAPRGRLVRQMLIESVLLAACGALVGVGLAVLITRSVATSTAVAIPMLASVRVDGWALFFSCILATCAGIVFGVLPALQTSKAGPADEIRATSRSLTSSLRSRWLRECLVVAEIAIACILLVQGGLLMQSFLKVLDVDLGFEPDSLAAWSIDTEREFDSIQAHTAFFESITREVSSSPGVVAVGLTDAIPLGINREWSVDVPGREFAPGEQPNMFPISSIETTSRRWPYR